MIETHSPPKLIVKPIRRGSYTEYYITAISTTAHLLQEQVEELYKQLVPVLQDNDIQVIQEKIHGKASVLPEFKLLRERELEGSGLDSSVPFTFVEGHPMDGQMIVSIQVWGISTRDESNEIRTDYHPETPVRVWENDDFRLLYSSCIHGVEGAHGLQKSNVTDQCDTMFERSTRALARYDMDFSHVARTWIYSNRLLDWYGEFNQIRTNHFRNVGLYSTEAEPVFPASTGIQGRFADEECFLDLLAVESRKEGGVEMTPINTSSRQQQAFGYGSAFSRGMVLKQGGFKTVYVSGTASINVFGESTYVGDAEMQSLDTLMNIAALLEDQGGSLKDIHMGTVYCKNREAYEAYKSSLRLLRIPEMPLVCVEADVCRHELLIEIEVVAVI